MTIELANRLVEFRKKFGYSQEQLANLLGVSRQSISNWESGEVTPSIDYLKELSKLYKVTLDELVSTDISVEETLNRNKNSEEKNVNDDKKEKKYKDYVHIGQDGIHVNSEDGDKVDIDASGIKINDESIQDHINGTSDFKFNYYNKYSKRSKTAAKISGFLSGIMSISVVIAYMLLGFLIDDGWVVYWTLFLLIPVPGLIISSFIKRKFSEFPIPLIVTFSYLFIGVKFGLWHPYWILFLAIPLYYSIVGPIDKAIMHKRFANDQNDCVINIDGNDIKVKDSSLDKITFIDKRIEVIKAKLAVCENQFVVIQNLEESKRKEIIDDVIDEIDDINDDIDELKDDYDKFLDENDLPLDTRISYKTRILNLKTIAKNLKEKIK